MKRAMLVAAVYSICCPLPALAADKDVNVVNTPTVSVQSSPDAPVFVDSAASARVPFQVSVQDLTPVPGAKTLEFDVPAGSVLVIEAITARIVTSTDAQGPREAFLETTAGGGRATHSLIVGEKRDDTGLGDMFIIGQSLRLYADAGSQVRFTAVVDPIGSAPVAAQMSVSGYLVPVGDKSLAP